MRHEISRLPCSETRNGEIFTTTLQLDSERAIKGNANVFRLRPTLKAMLAILLLASVWLPHLGATGTDSRPTGDAKLRISLVVELFHPMGVPVARPPMFSWNGWTAPNPYAMPTSSFSASTVDYCNDIGWNDPFSSHQCSERQRAYANRFRLSGVYARQRSSTDTSN